MTTAQSHDILYRRARMNDLPTLVAIMAADIRGQNSADARPPLDQRYFDAYIAFEYAESMASILAESAAEPSVFCCSLLGHACPIKASEAQ